MLFRSPNQKILPAHFLEKNQLNTYMITFMQFLENENQKYYYVGNCKNSFDDNGNSIIPQFSDTSDFACQEENAEEISKEQFMNLVHDHNIVPTNHEVIYLITQNEKIIMAHDTDDDIHYFFSK